MTKLPTMRDGRGVAMPSARDGHEPSPAVSAVPVTIANADEALGTLAWIIQQAEGAMNISAGASQTSGDPEGALQMLNSIASDIAINAEMLGEKLVVAPQYLIWSNDHQCWWAPRRCGYTENIERAGRYSRAEALGIAGTARGGWRVGKNPDEIAIPEPDAIEQATNPNRLEAYTKAQGETK